MPQKPSIHGRDHRPGGADPIPAQDATPAPYMRAKNTSDTFTGTIFAHDLTLVEALDITFNTGTNVFTIPTAGLYQLSMYARSFFASGYTFLTYWTPVAADLLVLGDQLVIVKTGQTPGSVNGGGLVRFAANDTLAFNYGSDDGSAVTAVEGLRVALVRVAD